MSKHNKSGVSQKGQVAVLGIDLSKKKIGVKKIGVRSFFLNKYNIQNLTMV
ncbi:hypothetical protein [Endozoicomonas sp.]|uniref:hypothetical protein n=1 Tax=Endozoicomonas sp. TaxID=1892382 RepID=UPI00383A7FB2